MPRSRSRKRRDNRRYQLEPQKRQAKKKSSPKWYPPLVLGTMGLGLLVIILNYMGILPFTGGDYSSTALVIGLVLIGAGFIGTTWIR